jgi:hypothetical protein
MSNEKDPWQELQNKRKNKDQEKEQTETEKLIETVISEPNPPKPQTVVKKSTKPKNEKAKNEQAAKAENIDEDKILDPTKLFAKMWELRKELGMASLCGWISGTQEHAIKTSPNMVKIRRTPPLEAMIKLYRKLKQAGFI